VNGEQTPDLVDDVQVAASGPPQMLGITRDRVVDHVVASVEHPEAVVVVPEPVPLVHAAVHVPEGRG
jgi:hypothetical protein